MVDDPDTAAELVSGGYEVSKSSVRRSAGSGVEVRVRAIRRRNWSTEDKLRIVGGTWGPGGGARGGRSAGAGVEGGVRASRRRNWSTEDKLRIVRETLAPGAVAKVVAERHSIGTGLLFTWRREMLAAAMSGLVPVEVMPETPRVEAAGAAPAGRKGG